MSISNKDLANGGFYQNEAYDINEKPGLPPPEIFVIDTQPSKKIEEEQKREKKSIKKTLATHFKGTFFAVMSALTVSLGGIFYKKAQTMSGSDNSVYRYVIQLVLMGILLKCKGIPLLGPKEQRRLLLLRSFFGIFAVVSTNFAIKYIDPSDNSALTHTNLIMIAIFARFYLKEKLNISHLIAFIFTIAGIILITKPTVIFPKQPPNPNATFANSTKLCGIASKKEISDSSLYKVLGVALALVGALGSACIHVVIRKLCMKKVYYGVNTLYGTFLGLPASVVISAVLIGTGASHKDIKCEVQNYPFDILYGIVGGFFAVVGHVFFNIALSYEDATKVALIRTIDLFFSFIFQYIILQIKSGTYEIIGACLIFIGTLIITLYKLRNKSNGGH